MSERIGQRKTMRGGPHVVWTHKKVTEVWVEAHAKKKWQPKSLSFPTWMSTMHYPRQTKLITWNHRKWQESAYWLSFNLSLSFSSFIDLEVVAFIQEFKSGSLITVIASNDETNRNEAQEKSKLWSNYHKKYWI